MPKLLKPKETAEILGSTVQTLAEWRCTKRYPLPYLRVGGRILYRHDDVEKFLVSSRQTVGSVER
jgi:hypothetical protein